MFVLIHADDNKNVNICLKLSIINTCYLIHQSSITIMFSLFPFVKRYAVRNVKIRQYAVRRVKIRQYAGGGVSPSYIQKGFLSVSMI